MTNFFAPSSRCGSPDELKALIDECHRYGLYVLMDIVHSHASKNIGDGISEWDGTDHGYFHSGKRGFHWCAHSFQYRWCISPACDGRAERKNRAHGAAPLQPPRKRAVTHDPLEWRWVCEFNQAPRAPAAPPRNTLAAQAPIPP